MVVKRRVVVERPPGYAEEYQIGRAVTVRRGERVRVRGRGNGEIGFDAIFRNVEEDRGGLIAVVHETERGAYSRIRTVKPERLKRRRVQ